MSKDQWLADVERILDDAVCEQMTREDAIAALKRMGFDPPEAEKMLNEAAA